MIYEIFKDGQFVNRIVASEDFCKSYCEENGYTYTPIPENVALTHDEINAIIVEKIRERYDVNEEFKMINLGISDPEDASYIEYRNYINECKAYGDSLEQKGGDV